MGRSTFNSQPAINAHDDSQVVVINGQIDNSRIVMLHGDVNEHSISLVIAQLLQLANTSRKPIYLVVSTYGGSIDEMFCLYDTIKLLPCEVHTIALGKVMSAGVLLLASGTKGKRMIGASVRIMMHPIWGSASGNVFEIHNEAKEFSRQQELFVETLARETKLTPAQIQKIMKAGHDFYIMPDKAVKYGIVDRIFASVP